MEEYSVEGWNVVQLHSRAV